VTRDNPLVGAVPGAGSPSAATRLDENATRMKERALGDVVVVKDRGLLVLCVRSR
jgi:hypothetical protein